MNRQQKPRVFSGIQPSGDLHIGNYLGAIKQWVNMQDKHDCIFCVVDYHAITVKQNPKVFEKNILDIARVYLASGIDPEKSVIFQQSEIKEHTELAWILNCIARMSDLNKMTQFKDKAGKNQENISVGLFDYPALMAADILLYNTKVVPVGEDQVQHVELTRDLAKRFNHQFGDSFCLPKAKILSAGARIMGLDDPTKKMSKSANSENNYIGLIDNPAKAVKKIMRATTDSGSEIKFDPAGKPGISNLLIIYSILANESIKNLEKKYQGKGYGDFKKELAETAKQFLIKFKEKFDGISDKEVKRIMYQGAEKIRPIAQATMERVKKRLGID
ncbi:MAG: tryptophan--tRNA ligase [Patescibacteria group bacterium]|nr:tryptophan--tRNA ligase [Patescibacteria group bacterium]